MRMAVTGAALFEPLLKWKPTTGLSVSEKWVGEGRSAEAAFRAMKTYLVGHDPARLEEMRFLIANPTASLV